MSKQRQPTPTASAVSLCPTITHIVGRLGSGSLPKAIAPPYHPQTGLDFVLDYWECAACSWSATRTFTAWNGYNRKSTFIEERSGCQPIIKHLNVGCTAGWSGGAMVLGKLPVPGRPTILITVGQGPIALAVGAGGGGLDIFTLIHPFSSFSLSFGDGLI